MRDWLISTVCFLRDSWKKALPFALLALLDVLDILPLSDGYSAFVWMVVSAGLLWAAVSAYHTARMGTAGVISHDIAAPRTGASQDQRRRSAALVKGRYEEGYALLERARKHRPSTGIRAADRKLLEQIEHWCRHVEQDLDRHGFGREAGIFAGRGHDTPAQLEAKLAYLEHILVNVLGGRAPDEKQVPIDPALH